MENENIQVVASFDEGGKFKPTAFKHGQKLYRVRSINLSHSIKRGAIREFIFNVSDGANNWILVFNTENLKWQLQSQFIYS